MKSFWKAITLSACAVALLFAGVAVAGMNPTNQGLPNIQPSSITGNIGLSSALTDNQYGGTGSLMCVACHGRNPSARIAAPTGTSQAADRHGSHWVTYTYADTASAGGYPGDGGKSGSGAFGKYLHRGPWAATASPSRSTGSSKYTRIVGTGAFTFQDSQPATSVTPDNTYQLICESCHNILLNTGPKKLLAQAIPNAQLADNGATLCAGCHGDMRSELNNEPNYFKTTGAQDHHRNQVQNITNWGTGLYTGTGSLTARGNFVTLDQLSLAVYDNANLWGWAVGPGQPPSPITTTAREIVPAVVSVTNGVAIPSGGELHCSSCHRAHNAISSTGALIIQAGTATGTAFGLLTNADASYATLGWVRKQAQVGNPSSLASKIIQDDNGLCVACHGNR